MGKKYTIFTFLFSTLLSFAPTSLRSQSSDNSLQEISSCLRRADAGCLNEYLGAHLELTFFNERRMYASGQARYVLEEFFNSYPVNQGRGGFEIVSSGNTSNSQFAKGAYFSTKGVMDVGIFLKLDSETGVYKIDRLNFTLR